MIHTKLHMLFCKRENSKLFLSQAQRASRIQTHTLIKSYLFIYLNVYHSSSGKPEDRQQCIEKKSTFQKQPLRNAIKQKNTHITTAKSFNPLPAKKAFTKPVHIKRNPYRKLLFYTVSFHKEVFGIFFCTAFTGITYSFREQAQPKGSQADLSVIEIRAWIKTNRSPIKHST